MAVRDLAAAYDALRTSTASYRQLPTGVQATVTCGPTAAAKVLFILRPNVSPPWDEAIRTRYGDDAAGYHRYLSGVADQLRSLANGAAVSVSDLPALVGRPASSPAKLIDEYNWVVISKRLHPPARDQLLMWADLAGRAPR
jgi:hypothetical protein